jgi:alkylation response protein AidB-like acyl-CoA dehydrogenase
MDFDLSPDQKRLQSEVREFANAVVEPSADERSRCGIWDPLLWRELGKARWPGVVMPLEYDGMGKGALEHAIIVEELCKVDGSIGGSCNLVQQCGMAILSFSPEAVKRRYLPLLARGETYSITAITEEAAGSKLSDMHTKATPDPDGWILNGVKSETHMPEHCRVCLVLAKTAGGITAFLVDTASPGFRTGRARDAVGLRGMPMAEVVFEDCRVPRENLLGREGGGYEVFFKSFDLTRIGNAAKAIGLAEGALSKAIAYARQRKVGRNVVTDFQGIRWEIAELQTRLDAARLLMCKAAVEYNATGRSTLTSAQAKLFACTIAMEATTMALQMTGSHGCFTNQPFARYMMDAKVSQLTGGSMEIQKNTIARELLGKETATPQAS